MSFFFPFLSSGLEASGLGLTGTLLSSLGAVVVVSCFLSVGTVLLVLVAVSLGLVSGWAGGAMAGGVVCCGGAVVTGAVVADAVALVVVVSAVLVAGGLPAFVEG